MTTSLKFKDSINRSEAIDNISTTDVWDVVVIGGGIHGAAFAHLAAQNKLKTLLLEKSDYASGTSSRSSKMAHGGLRYLEMFDFQQVFEGIKARDELFRIAPHIVRPETFLIPVSKNSHWFKLKLGVGLTLYDLFLKDKSLKHKWLSRKKLDFEGFSKNRTDLEGCYAYTDGLLNDTRLVLELIVAARREGATCLNYLEATAFQQNGELVQLEGTDVRSSKKLAITTKTVVNCAGPWVRDLYKSNPDDFSPKVKFSRGTHIIFDRPWTSPSLFLPMEGKSRYYFVWPHQGGTMVGTTERELTELPGDPQPTPEEIDEILTRLEHDLPESGLNRKAAHYAFAGVRTLPLRNGDSETGRLSRKHIWQNRESIFTLAGGKLTTARWTAFEGLKQVSKKLGKPLPAYDSAPYFKEVLDREKLEKDFQNYALKEGVAEPSVKRLISRFGPRCAEFKKDPSLLEEVDGNILSGEISFGLEVEQAETLEDLLRRRIEAEYLPGNGLSLIEKLTKINTNFESEAEFFRKRIDSVKELL